DMFPLDSRLEMSPTMELFTENSGCGVSVPGTADGIARIGKSRHESAMLTIPRLRSAVVALLLAASGAGGGSAQGAYTCLAYGGIKCANWTSVRSSKPAEAAVYEAWILGFISAYNAFVFKGPNVAAGTDFDTLRGMVDSHCKANPQDDLDSSAQSLIKVLLKKNPG